MSSFTPLTTLGAKLLDRLGDRNPQLLRELKGRLKRWPLWLTVGFALCVQLTMVVGFSLALPGPVMLEDLTLSTYPQIFWEESGNESPVEIVLPGQPSQTVTPDLLVSDIEFREPLRGDISVGLKAAEQMQRGDRLVAIEGHPADANLDNIRNQILGYTQRLSPAEQHRINTTVALTLYRPDSNTTFTVQMPRVAFVQISGRYCFEGDNYDCQVTPDQQFYQIYWQRWYQDIFLVSTLLIIFPLIGGGVFMLSNNLAEEKQRKTLNFLRLSPRSSINILTGKLLGVPICLYLAIALGLPLHWATGLIAGYGAGHILGLDVVIVSHTLLSYLLALFLILSVPSGKFLGSQSAVLATLAILFNLIILAIFNPWNLPPDFRTANPFLGLILFSPFTNLAYFATPQSVTAGAAGMDLILGVFHVNFVEYTLVTMVNAWGWSFLLAQGLQRRFQNPTRPLLERSWSYPITVIFVMVILGLTAGQARHLANDIVTVASLGLLYFMALPNVLAADRQAFQDWVRFRHTRSAATPNLPLWKVLLWGEESSPLLAIAANLGLAVLLFLSWFLWHHPAQLGTRHGVLLLGGGLLLFAGSIFFAVLVQQVMLLLPRKKGWLWLGSISSISCLVFPTMAAIALMLADLSPRNALFLGMHPELASLAIPLSLLGTVTAVLGFIHYRQFVIAGRSEVQQLLQGSKT